MHRTNVHDYYIILFGFTLHMYINNYIYTVNDFK